MNVYRNFLLTGWAFFLICLALPSMVSSGDLFYGYLAGGWAIYLISSMFEDFDTFQVAIMGIANIIALLSPLLLFKFNKFVYGVLFIFMSLGFIFATKLSFIENRFGDSYHIGYYVWLVSFFILSVTLAYRIFSKPKELNKA